MHCFVIRDVSMHKKYITFLIKSCGDFVFSNRTEKHTLILILSYCLPRRILYAKQKHLGCKKVRGQEEPATKSSDIK